MKNIIKILSLLFIMTSLDAKILEVSQLFNKKVVKVKEESIFETKSFYGETDINQESIKDIVLRVDGYITSLYANKDFMYLKKGDKMFTLYSDKIESIKKEIEISKSINTNLHKSSLEKLRALDITPSQIKERDISFYIPMNSIITKKMINDGSYIKKGMLLMSLASIDKIWFIAKVYQSDLSFLSKNLEAKVKLDGFSKSIKTKVDYIYPKVDKNSKTIDVRFILENKDLKIYPNMFGKVFIKSKSNKVLTLPKTAVLSKGDKYYVFKTLSNNEIEAVSIEAKRVSSNKYQILDGLKAGEEIINNALFLLDSDAITNNLYDDEDTDW